MATSEGYGQRLAERLRAEQAQVIVTRVLRTADMAVTETRCDDPVPGLSHSIQREDAYLVALTLRDFPNRQYWEDGRQMPVCDLRIGQVDFHDLRRDPVALLDKPYHDLFFYLPRSALDAIADDADAPRIGDLNHKPVASDDTTISSLGGAVLPALSLPYPSPLTSRSSRDRLARSFGRFIFGSQHQMIALTPVLVSTGASFRNSTSPMSIKSRRSC